MKNLMFLLLSILFLGQGNAQEIYFCLDYTVLGEPMRVSNSWNIADDGGYLYALYHHDEEIPGGRLYMVFSKEKDGKFVAIDKKLIVPEKGKTWMVVYKTFKEAGDYKITVMDQSEVLATEYLTIFYKRSRLVGKKKFKRDPRLLYANSRIIACETIEDGQPVNASAVFSVGEDEANEVTFIVQNDQSLRTDKLRIDIYRKRTPFDNYSDFLESKSIKIMHNKQESFFKLNFTEPGDYKVYVYDQDQIWINSGYITINSR